MRLRGSSSGLGARTAQIARLVLPLGAVALLSTVFLLSENIDPQRAVDMAGLDVAELTREPRIGTARFAGVTEDDTAMTIRAVAVRSATDLTQSGPIRLTLDAPDGDLLFTSGRSAQFRAEEGQIDQGQDMLLLRGNVTLDTSDGYSAAMPLLRSTLENTHLQGSGGIEAQGPPGQIWADTLELTTIPERPGGYLLAFRGNVRLIYLPEE